MRPASSKTSTWQVFQVPVPVSTSRIFVENLSRGAGADGITNRPVVSISSIHHRSWYLSAHALSVIFPARSAPLLRGNSGRPSCASSRYREQSNELRKFWSPSAISDGAPGSGQCHWWSVQLLFHLHSLPSFAPRVCDGERFHGALDGLGETKFLRKVLSLSRNNVRGARFCAESRGNSGVFSRCGLQVAFRRNRRNRLQSGADGRAGEALGRRRAAAFLQRA
jgi:hypothetical protein